MIHFTPLKFETKNISTTILLTQRQKVGFDFVTAVDTKMAVFWVVAPDYTMVQPRRQLSSETKV
jgi:hypothetical protein